MKVRRKKQAIPTSTPIKKKLSKNFDFPTATRLFVHFSLMHFHQFLCIYMFSSFSTFINLFKTIETFVD